MARSTIGAAIDRYLAAAGRAGAPVPDRPAPTADPYFVVRIRNLVEIDVMRSAGNAAGGSESRLDRLRARIQDAVMRGDMAAAQAAALPLGRFLNPGSADVVALAVRPAG
jgi:hypothetical protein